MKLQATVIMVVLVLAGCQPVSSVGIDKNEDGLADFYAYDLDRDGVPDTDEAGEIQYIWGTDLEKARQLDEAAPNLLGIAGRVIPGAGFLVALGLVWKKWPFVKAATNLIAAIQVGRKKIAEDGLSGGLEAFDSILNRILTSETQKVVTLVKKKENIKSVTDDV